MIKFRCYSMLMRTKTTSKSITLIYKYRIQCLFKWKQNYLMLFHNIEKNIYYLPIKYFYKTIMHTILSFLFLWNKRKEWHTWLYLCLQFVTDDSKNFFSYAERNFTPFTLQNPHERALSFLYRYISTRKSILSSFLYRYISWLKKGISSPRSRHFLPTLRLQ